MRKFLITKKTNVDLTVSNIDQNNIKLFLILNLTKEQMNYDWNVDTNSGKITSNNQNQNTLLI